MAGAETIWKAGAASTVITPAESMWLAGWAVRTESSRGILTDLYAKALAIEDHLGSRLVLLTVDLIAVSRDVATAVAAEVRRRWGVPRDRLMICASHTHCGPEVRPNKVPFFHIPPRYAEKIEPYVNWLTGRLVEVVGMAMADLRPAKLTARQTTAFFAHNRRGADAIDHDVPVLEVTAPDGRRQAVVFGYACHNTTMPPTDGRYCGDYAGFAQSALEADHPGMIALFVAGAGADQNPDSCGTIELARQHGRTLANAVSRCLTSPDAIRPVAGPLRVAYEEVPLDFRPLPPRHALADAATSDDPPTRTKAGYLLDRLDRGEPFPATYLCPLQAASFGDALLLIAIGGEPVIDYAHQLKCRHAAPGQIVWVVGYANDMFGYVPTAGILREGGYEGNRSVLWSALPTPFADNTEERVLAGIDRLVNQVTRD